MLRSKLVVMMLLAVVFQVFCGLAAHAQSIYLTNAWGQNIQTGNRFPLDRFSRGETCYVDIYTPDASLYRYEVKSSRGVERSGFYFCWYGWDVFSIPLSPNADNVTVYVTNCSNGRVVTKRIPIGTK